MTTQPPADAGRPPRHGISVGLALAAVVLVSLNLRPGASSVGPVLEELGSDLGMSPAVAGLMTALPGLCFGAVGALAVTLARQVGMSAGIGLGALAVVLGLLLRAATGSVPVFLALTALALAGMAVGNVLVPAWIKRHALDGGVRLMTLYSAGLTMGGAVAAAVVAPLSGLAPSGWRAGLGVWGVLALGALLPWAVIAWRERYDPADRRAGPAAAGWMHRSPTAVALTLLFGLQSMNAYVQFGWLPQIYRDAGLSAELAGLLGGLIAFLGIFGGLTMPTVIARSQTLAPWMVAFGALLVSGYTGLLLAPAQVPWLWAVLLGLSGWAFPTAIALITARTRDPRVTARVSGFVQPVGYVLAAVGPFAVGFVHEVTQGWSVVLGLLMVSGLGMTLAGLRVSRRVYVDDELAAA